MTRFCSTIACRRRRLCRLAQTPLNPGTRIEHLGGTNADHCRYFNTGERDDTIWELFGVIFERRQP